MERLISFIIKILMIFIYNLKKAVLFLVFLLAISCIACTVSGESKYYKNIEPESGFYFGIAREGITQSIISEYEDWLGFTPASYVKFIAFPMTEQDVHELKTFINEIASTGAIALITLEPMNGLDVITEQDCQEFASLCLEFEELGLSIMIRFAHEMNGSWYPWSQQPALYKEKFRMLGQSIHSTTHGTAMIWAPNSGNGYPFSGGQYGVKPDTQDFFALDTDGNGVIDMHDDMYTPYYPGDDAVDWVGMTVYHWGQSYPWFENELPEARAFSDIITGNYNGKNGDNRMVADFYAMFCSEDGRNKPMVITDTSAFYNTEHQGESEMDIKRSWWRQVYNISGDTDASLDISIHFPQIKIINWFDIIKNESEAGGAVIDWRISGNEEIRQAFIQDLVREKDGKKYILSSEDLKELNSKNSSD